jgi:hypothetical protein
MPDARGRDISARHLTVTLFTPQTYSTAGACRMEDLILVVEMMCCFAAWLFEQD